MSNLELFSTSAAVLGRAGEISVLTGWVCWTFGTELDKVAATVDVVVGRVCVCVCVCV